MARSFFRSLFPPRPAGIALTDVEQLLSMSGTSLESILKALDGRVNTLLDRESANRSKASEIRVKAQADYDDQLARIETTLREELGKATILIDQAADFHIDAAGIRDVEAKFVAK